MHRSIPLISASPRAAAAMMAATLASTLLAVLPVAAQKPATPQGTLAIANFSNFSDAEVSKYLTDQLQPELQQALRERGLAVVLTADTFDLKSGKACVANIGLAQAPPKGRNPRWPSYQLRSYTYGASEPCEGAKIAAVVESLNKTPLPTLLKDIEDTHNAGPAPAADEPADTQNVHLNRIFDQRYDSQPLFGTLHNFSLGEAVDYRHVMATVRSYTTRFDDGKLMCVAEAGFSARNPPGRNARMPASLRTYVSLQDGGDAAACEQTAALGATEQLMKDPWAGPKGRLKDFERVRESGLPLPDMKRVAAVEKRLTAAAQPAPQPATVRSREVNRVSCSNDCVNGNCIRTFADGRKERWQAPRVFDPFTNNWKWDTNSCGN